MGGSPTAARPNSGVLLVSQQALHGNECVRCKSGKNQWIYRPIGPAPIYSTNTRGALPCARCWPGPGKTDALVLPQGVYNPAGGTDQQTENYKVVCK